MLKCICSLLLPCYSFMAALFICVFLEIKKELRASVYVRVFLCFVVSSIVCANFYNKINLFGSYNIKQIFFLYAKILWHGLVGLLKTCWLNLWIPLISLILWGALERSHAGGTVLLFIYMAVVSATQMRQNVWIVPLCGENICGHSGTRWAVQHFGLLLFFSGTEDEGNGILSR